jgi:endogenous inhibitor of DNA gyrase (YacG/DUF329 family)
MRCPVCRQETFAKGNPLRPFCSERCKLIDLDNWLAGRYRISTPADKVERFTSGTGCEEAIRETASETEEGRE